MRGDFKPSKGPTLDVDCVSAAPPTSVLGAPARGYSNFTPEHTARFILRSL